LPPVVEYLQSAELQGSERPTYSCSRAGNVGWQQAVLVSPGSSIQRKLVNTLRPDGDLKSEWLR